MTSWRSVLLRLVPRRSSRTVLLGRPDGQASYLGPSAGPLSAARRARGQDLFDEIWAGELHLCVVPSVSHGLVAAELGAALRAPTRRAGLRGSGPANIGRQSDFRVPDAAYHRGTPSGVWLATAAIVVEVRSPDDETFEKFGFYFDHGVDEIVVADPEARTIRWWARGADTFEEIGHSALLDIDVAAIVAAIDWP